MARPPDYAIRIKLHWNPQPSRCGTGRRRDLAFTLDMAPDAPGASVFTAQLWSASLASALAWQEPWEGARWKVLQTPVTDGTGLDAALAVGMIATSARRPYPDRRRGDREPEPGWLAGTRFASGRPDGRRRRRRDHHARDHSKRAAFRHRRYGPGAQHGAPSR